MCLNSIGVYLIRFKKKNTLESPLGSPQLSFVTALVCFILLVTLRTCRSASRQRKSTRQCIIGPHGFTELGDGVQLGNHFPLLLSLPDLLFFQNPRHTRLLHHVHRSSHFIICSLYYTCRPSYQLCSPSYQLCRPTYHFFRFSYDIPLSPYSSRRPTHHPKVEMTDLVTRTLKQR